MRIETDHYGFDLPAEHAADILASIADADLRAIILRTIDETPEGEPVRLTLEYGDVVLHAFSEWEREEEIKRQPIETTGKVKGTFELPEGGE